MRAVNEMQAQARRAKTYS